MVTRSSMRQKYGQATSALLTGPLPGSRQRLTAACSAACSSLCAWGATVRGYGTYGTPEAGTRAPYVHCLAPRGKLVCVSGGCYA
eukprot:scaffold123610_cov60-Phaeocystis_antarctica.AAC.3